MKGINAKAGHREILIRKLISGLCFALLTLNPLGVTQASGQVEIQAPGNQSHTRAEIQRLKDNIAQARQHRQVLHQKATREERELGEAQKALSESQKQIRMMENALKKLQTDITQTETEILKVTSELAQHQSWIEDQIRRTYKHGQDNGLKLVLSGESPSDTARLLRYHKQIHEARQTRVAGIEHQQAHLEGLRTQQQQQQESLQTKQQQLQVAANEYQRLRNELHTKFAHSKKAVKTADQSITAMQEQTAMLENLLEDMILQETLEATKANSSFAQRKGRLALPVANGRILDTYQQPRDSGQGRWRGIWIQPTRAGVSEVTSIESGHVVFADWLLGYGLLTIIDHGQGYFSLYGHTQTLLTQPGDWVEANTPIAILHPDDLNEQPLKGLYFELRQQSDALNPLAWLK